MKIKFTIFAFLFLQFAESNSMMLRNLARALTVNGRVGPYSRVLRFYQTSNDKDTKNKVDEIFREVKGVHQREIDSAIKDIIDKREALGSFFVLPVIPFSLISAKVCLQHFDCGSDVVAAIAGLISIGSLTSIYILALKPNFLPIRKKHLIKVIQRNRQYEEPTRPKVKIK